MGRKPRRRIILAASVLTATVIIIVIAIRILGGVLQKNNISWSALSYHFPSSLTIEGIVAAPNKGFHLELEHLEVDWAWGSLLRLKPAVTRLHASSGKIGLYPEPDTTAGEPLSLPGISVSDVLLQDMAVDIISDSDSVRFEIAQLFLSSAATGERITADTLRLRQASLLYATGWSDETDITDTESDAVTSFNFEGLPAFEIRSLVLEQCAIGIHQKETRQQIDRLELALTGWKSTELLNVEVHRLGFVYQDTLEVSLVLENGEINREFRAELTDLGLQLPGASLQIDRISADLQEGMQGRLTLAPSYFSMGRIRQFYPGIDSILHPDLPDSTSIHLEGGFHLEDKTASIHSLRIHVMDSTSLEINGSAHLGADPVLDLHVSPFTSTRSNLVALLAPQNYHSFYLWPHEIDGEIMAGGNLANLEIRGSLDSREGVIQVESHVKSDSSDGFFFSLDIRSDSVHVNGITDLLPFPVPHGQVRFFLEMKGNGEKGTSPLWITITSDYLYAFDQYIQDILFSYYGDAEVDSMHVALSDTAVALTVDLVTPVEGDGTTYFEGTVDRLYASRLIPSLPDGSLSTQLKGRYLFGKDASEVELDLNSLQLTHEDLLASIPDSRIEMAGQGNRITLLGKTDEGPFLTARTGKAFPAFSLPLPDWLRQWPDTDVEMKLHLKETLVEFLTGSPGRLELESFSLVKDSLRWNAHLLLPEVTYGEQSLVHTELAMNSQGGTLTGTLGIEQLRNGPVLVEGIHTDLGYRDQQYWLGLRNENSELAGANQLAFLVDASENSYNIRFNDTVPLVINSNSWQVGNNQGIVLDEQLRLLEGNLGISHGASRLEAVTNGESVMVYVDSLELTPLLSFLTDEEGFKARLDAEARVSLPEIDLSLDASIAVYNDQVPDPVEVTVSGERKGETLQANIDIQHMDAAASAMIRKEAGPITYALTLDRIDLAALRYIPSLPPDLEASGRLTGRATGTIGEEITTNGFLIAEELYVVPPVTGSPLRVDHDSVLLKNGEILLHDFRIKDSRGEYMSLQGNIRYSPDLYGSLRLKSDQFALLQNQEEASQLQGNLIARADLQLEGDTESVMVTGNLQTLPGAEVRYISEKSFRMVDASQIVNFVDLDETDSAKVHTPPATRVNIDWDVDLQVSESAFEILLDEVTQEYIRIVSQGTLNLRSGTDQMPLVFGSVTSSDGHAFISPPAIPDLDLVVENATIRWDGLLDEPVISFRGYKLVKGLTSGLSQGLEESNQLVDYKVYVILDQVTLSEFDLQFDLEVEDSEAQILLASLPKDTRQAYALNLLVFGRIGTERIEGNAMLANQVTQKLNELSRRNLKNTGLNFSSANYTDRSDGMNERERTDLNYSLSRGFLNNRLSVSVGGSVGFYMDDLTVLPPSNLIGDVELSYRLSDSPTLILKGTRQNVYEGIIDGMVTEESVGLTFQKSYPTFPLLRKNTGEQQGGNGE